MHESDVIVNCNYDDLGMKTGGSWYCRSSFRFSFLFKINSTFNNFIL